MNRGTVELNFMKEFNKSTNLVLERSRAKRSMANHRHLNMNNTKKEVRQMSSVVVSRNTQWETKVKEKLQTSSVRAEVIARYQGRQCPGHTIQFNGVTIKHLIPSGIFHQRKSA